MIYIIDIIIVLLVALSVYFGYKRGFVKTVFSCFSLIIALVAASWLGPYAGSFIRTTSAYESMTVKVRNEISEYFDSTVEDGKALSRKADFETSPLASSLIRFGANPEELSESYEKALESGAENVRDDITKKVTDNAMSCLANALGKLIVFIMALIVLKILSVLLGNVVKLPVLYTLNRIAGLFAGFILGLFTVFILCMAIEILLPFIPDNPVVYMGMSDRTTIYRMFLNLNPVILLLFA